MTTTPLSFAPESPPVDLAKLRAGLVEEMSGQYPRSSRRARAAVVVAVASLAAVIVAAAVATESTEPYPRLVPANISALRSADTLATNTPDSVASLLEHGEASGAVHVLGGGVAFAWERNGGVCELAYNTSGCVPELSAPVAWTVGEPDVVGDGDAPRVYGLAVDEVLRVTITLRDGRAVSREAVDNYYDIPLPADARPWDATELVAHLRDGRTYSEQIAPQNDPT